MRTAVKILSVFGICLLLLLINKQHHKNASPSPNVATTNPSSPPASLQVAQPSTVHLPPRQATTNIVYVETSPGKTHAINSFLLDKWQAPIDFYGKVIDQNSNPVNMANIHFQWNEFPTEDGMRNADIRSDTQGLFSLEGAIGLTLKVSVGKNGYYSSSMNNNFYTYGSLGGAKFFPDSQNPVVFHLRKKGRGESLITLKRNYRIPRDGTPTAINLSSGASSTSDNGDFVVQCWTKDAGKHSGKKYDWHCVMTIPGGGAITNDDEFAFEAPETGYKPSLEISMPADRPDWRNDVDLKFYYLLANGCYGRMTFSMIAGGQHFCMIDSVFNPSGSRDLEPAQ